MGIALNLALNSTCRTRHASIIVAGNRILSQGINLYRTHPIYKHYQPHVETIHAEAKALISAKIDISGLTLYSVRNYNGVHANSKPCKSCMGLIIEAGISNVVFFENGEYKKVRL